MKWKGREEGREGGREGGSHVHCGYNNCSQIGLMNNSSVSNLVRPGLDLV